MTDRVSVLPAVSLEAAPNPLQAQYVEIKDLVKPQAKGADAPKGEVGDAFFNSALHVKPTEVGEGFRDAQAAARAFMQGGDKSEALTKTAPAFETAIKQSDADYIAAIGKYSPDYNQKRHDVSMAQTTAVMGMQGLKAAFAKVPEEKQPEVQMLIALASDSEVSAALRASVRKEMDKFPGLGKSFDIAQSGLQAEEKAVGVMVKAAQPLMHAAYEQAATRYIYAHAMELGGNAGPAVLLKQEGQSKITDAAHDYLDAPKPPSKVLSA